MENQEIIKEAIHKLFNSITNNYIFIYTPPKVGSTTLVSSLRISLGKSYNIIHIHDEIMLFVLTGINNISINHIIKYLTIIGKNVYVIDIYRSPIERKMSEFFEKISCYHFNNSEENLNNYKIERFINRFNNLFPHLANGEHYFDKYEIPIQDIITFDFNKKYTIQVINNINYIKLRLCDSNIWGQILSDIFKQEIIIINDYLTDNKNIGDLYKKFKNEYRLPSNFFYLISNCKYFNFYYSEEERNSYLDIWNKKLDKEFNPYTTDEYNFYLNLCLENQYINDIQIDHYIDNGCYCKLCNKKRRDIFFKAKNGEHITEKLIHYEIINNDIDNKNKKLVEVIKTKISSIKTSNKFKPNQFCINHIKKR
jgi:hypothetical protein